ncbi:MAG TPA: bifunctional ADP-heptose synthase [Longimicrobiales bacterium]|nr:bifunctional ADP-heptose synthase [Longimicrobiales bacterium]
MDGLSLQRLDEVLERAPDVRVLVVGDVMLDVYFQGSASRISPEAPVPVVRIEEQWRALGGAANVAANVVALGAQCSLAGVLGGDGSGAELRGELVRTGIDDAGLIEQVGRQTTVKTRIMARHQQVARYDMESDDDLDEVTAQGLAEVIRGLVRDAHAVVLEDYNKGVLVPDVIDAALDASREAGIPVIVDPKSRSFFDYGGCTVFKPNLPELAAALRDRVHPDDPEWMEDARARLGCAHLLLTLGEDGMVLATESGGYVRVPTVARSVYDVSGAGDTVVATVAVALASGASIEEAALIANHAAGVEVGKAGVATVSPQELRAAVRSHEEAGAEDARSAD